MQLIKPYTVIEQITPYREIMQLLEQFGRTCYKSEDKITHDSSEKFVRKIISLGHHSVIEHGIMSVRFIIDRGVSHELVRHRIASFSQESTRYCNYSKKGITFIVPPWVVDDFSEAGLAAHYTWHDDSEFLQLTEDYHPSTSNWLLGLLWSEKIYNTLISNGWSPQQARSVLPNSLKTEIVMTANFREWREVFRQRTAQAAHPQMREVMIPLLAQVQQSHPVIFEGI